jgi:hypothetical protein
MGVDADLRLHYDAGMSDINHIDSIERRRQEIAAEIAKLQAEADELDITLRVLKRFSPDGSSKAEPRLGPPRPAGTPTTFEMVSMVLTSAEKEGNDGLTAGEIVNAIRTRYWPDVTGPQILPSIYRFIKQKRFHKTAGGKIKRKAAEPPQ